MKVERNTVNKRIKMKSTKQKPLSKLKKELDSIFSKYIRVRNADKSGSVRCYTCGKRAHWKEMHCGHYISRVHSSTRWNEINCQVQCPGCNLFKQGAADEFAIKLIKDYGEGILDVLNQIKHNGFKPDRDFYENSILNYKIKANALETKK